MKQKSTSNAKPVEMLPGIVRKTLSYNNEAMLCHFDIKKGSQIPLHKHVPVQIGYCLNGRVKFIGERPEDTFEAVAGDGYVIDSNKVHGAEALEDSAYIEVFTPMRPEYKDF